MLAFAREQIAPDLRGYGLSDHPNILGGCIAFGLILILAVILHGKRNERMLASIIFIAAALPPRQSFLLGPSTVFCVAV